MAGATLSKQMLSRSGAAPSLSNLGRTYTNNFYMYHLQGNQITLTNLHLKVQEGESEKIAVIKQVMFSFRIEDKASK